MKAINKILSAAVAAAAVSGGLLLGASPASAATAPAWEPDANGNGGTLSFYDSTGHQITGGNNLSHLFDYAAGNTAEDSSGFHKASLSFAYPNHSLPTSSWFVNGTSVATTYPVAGAQNDLATVPAADPVSHPGATEMNLSASLGGATLDATAGYANIVQIRMQQTGTSNSYYTADISYNTANNTWTQIYPAVVSSTTTTLTASANPAITGSNVTLTATVSPSSAAGTVQFKDGGTNLGTPVTVSSGSATKATSFSTTGNHPLSAVFTPTDPSSFNGSTGNLSETVNPPATSTTTTLAVSGGYATAGSAATLTATVNPSAAPGSVAFFDNGSSTPIAGTVTNPTAGQYVLDLPSGFNSGGHSVVAKFSPTDVTQFQASQSAAQTFLTQAAQVGACAQPGSVCTETQNVQATVPVGTLVISTPYTATSPLDLGTLSLSADSTKLTGSAQFQHILVTDTRAGNLPWTVQALATNLSDGGSHSNSVINAQNLGLTGVVKDAAAAGFTGTLTAVDNPAAGAVAPNDPGSAGLGGTSPHTVVSADHGLGSVEMNGLLSIIAPSSTEPGLFTGTITFTVG